MRLDKHDPIFREASWEKKAKANLAWAIQTTDDVRQLSNSDLKNLEIPAVKGFWDKGTRVYLNHLLPLTSSSIHNPEFVVVEFGCGVGRVLRNFAAYAGQAYGVDISKTQIKYGKN